MVTNDRFTPDETFETLDDGSVAGASLPRRYQVITEDGAVSIADGTVFIDDGSAVAVTLTDPPEGMSGAVLTIIAQQGAAHTITLSADDSGFNSAGSSSQQATLSGEAGDGVQLYANDGSWYVLNWQDIATSVTFAATS